MPPKRSGSTRNGAKAVGTGSEAGDAPLGKDGTEGPPQAKTASGRTTPKGTRPGQGGSKVGRPKTAQESGRYTPPIPRSVRKSSRVFGVSIIAVLLIGVLMILFNYLSILPGSVSIWYLLSGLAVIFTGSMMATHYR